MYACHCSQQQAAFREMSRAADMGHVKDWRKSIHVQLAPNNTLELGQYLEHRSAAPSRYAAVQS